MGDDDRHGHPPEPQDARDARAAHEADRPPTEDEERAAEQAAKKVPTSVAEHAREMSEIGAQVKGEGQIAP